jgi:hypothetical protein
VLLRYWIKGRFTRSALIGILMGEAFSILFILFAGGTFLSFSSRFGVGTQISEIAWSATLGFYLIGLVQSGFNGSGLPITSADVDYVFTSPVKTREVFAAKVLLNSLTTVLFAFPPIVVLYLRLSSFYGTSLLTSVIAAFVTLVYFVIGLFISADVSLSLGSGIGSKSAFFKNLFVASVLVISFIPFVTLIPRAPLFLASLIRVLPNGLAAEISVGLVSGSRLGLTYVIDLAMLLGWFACFLLLGIRISRNQFYELLQVGETAANREMNKKSERVSQLNPRGKSVWFVIRNKEKILIKRTGERRGLVINALFLSVFLVIYALSGTFYASPTSFLFILFIIGSFGSGNASRWIEKERLWVLKTSTINLRKYMREVFRARLFPLLTFLIPTVVVVGISLALSQFFSSSRDLPPTAPPVLGMILAPPAALEIAAITMGGGMYFSSKFGQSTSDDLLSSQTQELADIKRFLYQTLINLVFVGPLMLLVLGSVRLTSLFGNVSIFIPAAALLLASIAYTYGILLVLLNGAGDSISRREDL